MRSLIYDYYAGVQSNKMNNLRTVCETACSQFLKQNYVHVYLKYVQLAKTTGPLVTYGIIC